MHAMRNMTYGIVRDCGASIAILTALLLTTLIALSALVIDVGALYLERRRAQGTVDLAAIAAASDLSNAAAAANATVRANGYGENVVVTTTLGQYAPDPALAPAQRFAPNAQPYNAAQVTLAEPGTLYFARAWWRAPVTIGVGGIASSTAEASFSVGSHLASVRGGLLNALLGALLGGNVTLSVMDYNALLQGNVTLGSFLNALAVRLNIKSGTYNDVLNANATVGDALAALIAVTGQNGQTGAAQALVELAAAGGAGRLALPLDQVISLGQAGYASLGQTAPGLDSAVSIMGLVTGAATIANGSHQVTLDLGATVPGVASVKIDLAIGEPLQYSGWVAVGQNGAVLDTSQLRLRLVAQIGGAGLLSGLTIRLPVLVNAANATARLAATSCTADGSGTASIGVTPGIVDAWIGDTRNLASSGNFSVVPATLVQSSLISATASAHAGIENTSETMLTFDQADVTNGTVKTVDTSDYLASIVSTLLRQATLKVNAGGLSLSTPGPLQAALAQQLAAVAAPIDAVVHDLLEALGVHLGEADVQVYGIRCQGAVLGG
jgi:uncharacterized membrane protein